MTIPIFQGKSIKTEKLVNDCAKTYTNSQKSTFIWFINYLGEMRDWEEQGASKEFKVKITEKDTEDTLKMIFKDFQFPRISNDFPRFLMIFNGSLKMSRDFQFIFKGFPISSKNDWSSTSSATSPSSRYLLSTASKT